MTATTLALGAPLAERTAPARFPTVFERCARLRRSRRRSNRRDEWTFKGGKVSSTLSNTIGIMEAYKKAGLGGPFIMSLQRFDGFLKKLGVAPPLGEDGAFSDEAADVMRPDRPLDSGIELIPFLLTSRSDYPKV